LPNKCSPQRVVSGGLPVQNQLDVSTRRLRLHRIGNTVVEAVGLRQ